MKKVEQKIKSEKGVTLVALAAMLVIAFTILSVVLYNGRASAKLESLNNMYSDIQLLEEKIQLSYIKNEGLPIIQDSKENFEASDLNPNDLPNEYYKIDKSILKDINLNNSISDYYVNKATLTVYYIKGHEYDGNIYHTIPRKFAKLNIDDDLSKSFKLTLKKNENDIGDDITYSGRYKIESMENYFDDTLNSWIYFNGWKDKNGKYYRYAYRGVPNTLIADWIKYKEKIKVTFYDGTLRIETKEYSLGEIYGTLLNITSDGRKLLGWKNSKGEIITEDMKVTTEDTELYAIWDKEDVSKYTIIFNPIKGKVERETLDVRNGSKYGELPVPTPESEDYVFEGWYLERNFVNKITRDTIVSLTGDTSVYARYNKIHPILTYDFNNENIQLDTTQKELNNGESYGELYNYETELDGKKYRIEGWYKTKECNAEDKVNSEDIVDLEDDITLYAKWIEE